MLKIQLQIHQSGKMISFGQPYHMYSLSTHLCSP